MNLDSARTLAEKLMRKHDLLSKGWVFDFDRATSRLGATHFGKKKITISKHMTAHATRDLVEQVVLHEIAHALLPRQVGHGAEWKNLARRIGYTGGRTLANPYRQERNNVRAFPSPVIAYNRPDSMKMEVGATLRLPTGDEAVIVSIEGSMVKAKVGTTGHVWKLSASDAKSLLIPKSR